jgi:surface protein
MCGMFNNATSFNQDISNWDVSAVTDMGYMFNNASSFNQDISNWDVSAVTNMTRMFSRAGSFNQDISHWDVSKVARMSYMFTYVTLSTPNYDVLLKAWSMQTLQDNVQFSGGNSTYSSSSQSARDVLTGTFGWTITDGGVDQSNP